MTFFKIRLKKLQNNILFQHARLQKLNIRSGVKFLNLKNKLSEFCRTLNVSQMFPLANLPIFTLLSLYRNDFG